MATDSDIKLTKHKSAVTVVTADFANSIFGGLYGSADGSSLNEEDPRVRGHVHTGLRGDGHAQRVHLVDHVTSQLTNHNLADDAVTKRNVYDSIHVDSAIPEYRVDFDGGTYYYLDLRHIRADFVFKEEEDPAGDGSQNRLIRQRSRVWDDSLLDINGNPGPDYVLIPDVWTTEEGFDFVFGSSSLDDLGAGAEGDSRLQFDKSKSAFRAGRVQGDEWDDVNRGVESVALGYNAAATAEQSTVSGGGRNRAGGSGSTVAGGYQNVATGAHSNISGGQDNNTTSDYSSIGGGSLNAVSSDHSAILGGYNNSIEAGSGYNTISGGKDNTVKPNSEYGVIVGGTSNEVDGKQSVIIGGDSAYVSGLESISVGGSSSKIVASNGSITVGYGSHATPLTIGYGYTSFNNVSVPPTPSKMSGVVGGYSNHIAGGILEQAESNFLIGGSNNKLGGIDAYVSNSQIFGGLGNEVAAYDARGYPGHINHGLIVGGEQNFILMGEASSNILSSGIIGGFQNSINWIPHTGDSSSLLFTSASYAIAPWFRPTSYGINSLDSSIGPPERGVQTSYIFGGVKNSISNSTGNDLKENSLYSATLGGHSNVVSSGYGSSILGGGAFVDPSGAGVPPYDTLSEYYANVIQDSHHSSILNGSSNLIKQYTFPFDDAGPIWSTNAAGDELGVGTNLGVYSKDPLPVPLFCVAEGRESYSYLYGQHAHASGGYDKETFETDQNFLSASIHHIPTGSALPTISPAAYMVQLGSEVDSVGTTLNQPGSAQTSALEFFGSWTYSQEEIPSASWTDNDVGGTPDWTAGDTWLPAAWNALDPVSPTNVPWFEFRSYLGGGRDDINAATHGPNRCFIPRFPASYQFVINGALSFTSMNRQDLGSYGGKYGIGSHEVISFTYTGYIVMQPDGGGKYGGILSNVMSSDGTAPASALRLFDPTATGGVLGDYGLVGSNFSIGFCPHWLIGPGGTGEVIWPLNAYQGSTAGTDIGTSCYGSWNEPSSGMHGTGPDGVTSWPPKFSLYVVNNTGSSTELGEGNGTGELFIGESLVARAEVVENLLFLGRYNPTIPL